MENQAVVALQPAATPSMITGTSIKDFCDTKPSWEYWRYWGGEYHHKRCGERTLDRHNIRSSRSASSAVREYHMLD
jgi:hypothetical protein